jgi:polar amino acid transport system substrate-binding protein
MDRIRPPARHRGGGAVTGGLRGRGAIVPAFVIGGLLAATACSGSSGASSRPAAADGSGAPQQSVDETLRAMLPAGIRASGVLRIGTTTGNAPMDFATADGKPQGVDIDLSKAAAQLLGLKTQYTETEFSGLIAGQLAGRFDVIWAAMNDNALREKQVTFVNYFKHGFSVLVPKGNPHHVAAPADFCGLKFAEAQGSVFQTLVPELSQSNCVSQGKAPIKVEIYPDNQSVTQALTAGRVDVVMAAQEQVTYIADLNSQLQAVPTINLSPVQYGIGITPGNTALVKALQATLTKMVANGSYAAIVKKWKLQDQGITKITVNQSGVS